MLFLHCERRAASRACCTAGSNRATRTAMIAMTTRSSMSVNARRSNSECFRRYVIAIDPPRTEISRHPERKKVLDKRPSLVEQPLLQKRQFRQTSRARPRAIRQNQFVPRSNATTHPCCLRSKYVSTLTQISVPPELYRLL